MVICNSPSYVNTIRLKAFTRDCFMSTDHSTCMQICKLGPGRHRQNLKLSSFRDISWIICAVRMGICNRFLCTVAAFPSKVLLSHVCVH